MPGRPLLSIHLGAAGVRITATRDGLHAPAASAAVPVLAPQPGWAEQPPDDWWRALREAVAAIGREAGLGDAGEVRLGASLQASVFLDGEREVIRPAILASDSRAPAEAAEVASILGYAPPWPLAAHLLWMRRHQTIAFKRVRTVLSPKACLRFRLTGALACDPGDAASTGLFDVHAGCWSRASCDALEISPGILPPLHDPRATLLLDDDAAGQMALPRGIRVVG